MIELPLAISVNSSILQTSLDGKFVSGSYKFFWIHSIMQEITKRKRVMEFELLASHMIVAARDVLSEQNIALGEKDKLSLLVEEVFSQFAMRREFGSAELLDLIKKSNEDSILKKTVQKLFDYAPYRFLSPFFHDSITGMKECDKNAKIEELSQNDENDDLAPYIIFSDKQIIVVNSSWAEYLFWNQDRINSWIDIKFNEYLEKINQGNSDMSFVSLSGKSSDY